MSKWEILQGDVRKKLKELPDEHFDAVLSDPPYAYKFMGHRWDYALPSVNVWTELLRVVKPGAHVLLFGGPRTFHRLVCAVEDAGFIPLDLLMYLHAKGFPKSHDIAKAIDKQQGHWRGRAGKVKSDNNALGGPNLERTPKGEATTDARRQWSGWGTALKPAYEPVLLAMKMIEGTYADNVQSWGTGALAIDACRVGDSGGIHDGVDPTAVRANSHPSGAFARIGEGIVGVESAGGRWPANVILDEEAAKQLDAMSGNRPGMSGGGKHRPDYSGGMFGGIDSEGTARGDNGGASRFFFTTKVSRVERELGCDDLEPERANNREPGSAGTRSRRAGPVGNGKVHNHHPTLKAIELTRWLATLLLPPPRTDGVPRRILVPYSGAGSEIIGALQAGWDEVVGVEGEAAYIEIAKSRIKKGGVFSGLLDKRMRSTAGSRQQAAGSRQQAAGRLVYGRFAKDKGGGVLR